MYIGYRQQPRSDYGFTAVLYFAKMWPNKFTALTLIDACVSPSFRDYSLAPIGTNFGPTFVNICQMERLNDGHTHKQTYVSAPNMAHK